MEPGQIRVMKNESNTETKNENVWSQGRIRMTEDNGVYVRDMMAASPENKDTSVFTWPGMQR